MLRSENTHMQRILERVAKFAPTEATVIIQGESGTGKEVLAHTIHERSARGNGPFVKIDCAAMHASLIESELFGYDEGAFTGARKGGKPGRLAAANGGTLFLDEIGELPASLQAKLLRVLEERCYEPVGSTRTLRVDVRIIVATNRNLNELVQQGQFRLDLFQRLNVFHEELPPLRERIDDIQMLTTDIVQEISKELGRPLPTLSPQVKAALLSYHWPGNIRQLRNVITHALTLAEPGAEITLDHLPDDVARRKQLARPKLLKSYVEETERNLIRWVLKDTPHKDEAARKLGISRAALYKKLNRYGLLGDGESPEK